MCRCHGNTIKYFRTAAYKKMTRPITERVISQLIAEYNINEEYLRHGTGEMFVSHRADIVAELAAKLQQALHQSCHTKYDEYRR